jgi:hypothetical protein
MHTTFYRLGCFSILMNGAAEPLDRTGLLVGRG